MRSRFENLKSFLSSEEATGTISQELLDAMRQEVAAAQVREAYWSGVSVNEDENSAAAPADDCSTKMLSLEPRGYNAWIVGKHADKAPLQSGQWTLWTYVSPA